MVMIKHIKFYFVGLLAALSLIVSPVSLAANIQVTVNKTKVVKNEVFQLRVVVDEKVSSDDIDFSPLEKDFYLGRPSFGMESLPSSTKNRGSKNSCFHGRGRNLTADRYPSHSR